MTDCPCKRGSFEGNLWSAAQWGQEERVRHLLSAAHSADPNKVDEEGYTALIFAAQKGHDGVIRALLAAGALVSAGGCGATPLHRAAYSGHTTALRLLLAAPSARHILDARDSSTGDLRTALGKAAWQGHADAVRLLLESGADPRIASRNGRTPLQDAEDGGHGAAAALLRETSAAPATAAAESAAAATTAAAAASSAGGGAASAPTADSDAP